MKRKIRHKPTKGKKPPTKSVRRLRQANIAEAEQIIMGHTPWNDERATVTEFPDAVVDRSEIVSGMRQQRELPKGPSVDYAAATPPYPWQAVESAKMRSCLTECAQVIAEAIESAARIMANGDNNHKDDNPWHRVGPGTPIGTWLVTRRQTGPDTWEGGTNLCMCRVLTVGDDPEWIEQDGGRTTVTHTTFAPPTEWRWPVS